MRFVASVFLVCLSAAALADSPTKYDLVDTKGQSIGSVSLEHAAHATILTLEADIAPGAHAMHVHAHAKCDTPDFKSAGDHYNPSQAKHGVANEAGHHAGDLPNLFVEPSGHVKQEIFIDAATELKGRSIVIHATLDDHKTDPAGSAGNRIACAAIQ